MTTSELRAAHLRRPFIPFTIKQADGTTTRVTHPEALAYRGGRIAVYLQPQGGTEIIDLLLVNALVVDASRERKKPRGS